jgi:phage tail sheath protein FI
MAETLVSPGVLAIEIDTSFVSSRPVQAGAAIIGPTVQGPVNIPTIVTTWSDYQNKFGTTLLSASSIYTYFTSITAYNYFQNGGTSLLVSRVVSGTYSPATSSITNNVAVVPGVYATASKNLAAITDPINIEFRIVANSDTYRFLPTASGNYQDDVDGKLYFFASGALAATVTNLAAKITGVSTLGITAANSTNVLVLSGSVASSTVNGYIFQTGSGTSFSSQATLGGGINGSGGTAFVLKTISEGKEQNSGAVAETTGGILPSGSAENIRWQVTSVNTSSGTFNLVIRQGNDNTLNPVVLETWTNLSLDPFSSNYIAKRIGDQTQTLKTDDGYYLQTTGNYQGGSKYVRVTNISNTPNYLDSNGAILTPSFTSSLPLAASGSFGGAVGQVAAGANFYENINDTNTQGVNASNYDSMIGLLANKDDYQYNIMLTPGICNNITTHTDKVNDIISTLQNRGDAIYVVDLVDYGNTVNDVVTGANAKNTSYAASYWPWVQVVDPNSGQNVWVPASTVVGGVYAYNDSVSEPWFAPAGINRGGLSTVIQAERKLPQSSRDTLYNGKVNPIATFPGTGVVVYGQKTLQTKASALDRVNVRRLLIALKGYISQVANTLVFEQNSVATRNNFLAQVNPYLENVQQRQGLYAFKVIMDDSNNTADVVDRNELVGQIYLQPTKTAEFIYLDFNITPTGATFPG